MPRDFHFVFGLAPQAEPLHVVHYLCLASCLATQDPSTVHFHCRHTPHGEWWERIAPRLAIQPVTAQTVPMPMERYRNTQEGRYILDHGLTYAHEADFLRLRILAESGGAYVDMDTLFLERYPDELFSKQFAIAEEAPRPDAQGVMRPSLCNAVMFARAGAVFPERWLARMTEVFDGTWSRHSCQEAGLMWGEGLPMTVLPRRWFYAYDFSRADIAALLVENAVERAGVLSIHLWAHLWWSAQRTDFSTVNSTALTPRAIAEGGFTYARLARRFLPADAAP